MENSKSPEPSKEARRLQPSGRMSQKYGDEQRKASIDVLRLKVSWHQDDIKKLEEKKRFLTSLRREMIEELRKCGVELR